LGEKDFVASLDSFVSYGKSKVCFARSGRANQY